MKLKPGKINKYNKVKSMYDLIGKILSKYQYGPKTMNEIAIEEQDLVYRGYKMSHSKHHLKVNKESKS
jgi:hypothetical protein